MAEKFDSTSLHKALPKLHESPAVKRDAAKAEERGGKKLPDSKPGKRIEAHVERLKNIFDRSHDDATRLRRVDSLARLINEQLFSDKLSPAIRARQMNTLKPWLAYLTQSQLADHYTPELRYFIVSRVLEMGAFIRPSQYPSSQQKEPSFQKRSATTRASFPHMNAEALAKTVAVLNGANDRPFNIDEAAWKQIAESGSFAKVYAHFLHESELLFKNRSESITGTWDRVFKKDSNASELTAYLKDKNTGWCIAEQEFAEDYLALGDIYLFSVGNDKDQPRICIRLSGDEVVEIRGTEGNQGLDPRLTDILDQKLAELKAQGIQKTEEWATKIKHSRKLFEIVSNKDAEELSKDDLRFIWEVDSPFEGFEQDAGPPADVDPLDYQYVSPVEKVRKSRDCAADIAHVFGCKKEEVAFLRSDMELEEDQYFDSDEAYEEGDFDFESNYETRAASAYHSDLHNAFFKNPRVLVGDLIPRGQNIYLPDSLEVIIGDVDLTARKVESLANIKEITGTLTFEESQRPLFNHIKTGHLDDQTLAVRADRDRVAEETRIEEEMRAERAAQNRGLRGLLRRLFRR